MLRLDHQWLLAVAAALGLSVAACNCQPVSTTCQADDECPNGYQCRGAVCTRINADAAMADASMADTALVDAALADTAIPDSGASDMFVQEAAAAEHVSLDDSGPPVDASIPPVPCGTVQALQDDFMDGQPEPQWRKDTYGGCSIGEGNGSLLFRMQLDSASGYAAYRSQLRYRLRDSAILVEVNRNPGLLISTVWFWFGPDEDNNIGFWIENGNFGADIKIDGTSQGSSATGYDPSEHKWWKIREAAGLVFLEYSQDGTNWNLVTSGTSPGYVESGTVNIGAGFESPLGSEETVEFTNLNHSLEPVPYCPASTLRDSFTDQDLGEEWTEDLGLGCSLTTTGTGLQIGAPASAVVCAIRSLRGFELDESGLLVHVASAPTAAGANVGLLVRRSDGLWWEFALNGETIVVYGELDGLRVFSDQKPRLGMTWLRMRKINDLLLFDTRATASDDWTTPLTATANDTFDAIQIGVEVNVPEAPGTVGPFVAVFDSFNLP